MHYRHNGTFERVHVQRVADIVGQYKFDPTRLAAYLQVLFHDGKLLVVADDLVLPKATPVVAGHGIDWLVVFSDGAPMILSTATFEATYTAVPEVI